jgi:uncharacterized coiled-coil DUF342 family protein
MARSKPKVEEDATVDQEHAELEAEVDVEQISDRIEELLRRGDILDRRANSLKSKRDEMNAESKKFSAVRDNLNERVKALMKEMTDHKGNRDRLNDEVRKAKEIREEKNREVGKLERKLSTLRKDKMVDKGLPLPKLRSELRAMEFNQQTLVLSPEKERALVDKIEELQRQIRERDEEIEKDKELKGFLDSLRSKRSEAEEAHSKVTELADAAQREHEAMESTFNQIVELRSRADKAHRSFLDARKKADGLHEEYISLVKEIRDIRDEVSDLRARQRALALKKAKREAEESANEVLAKLRSGKKLGTDDLLTLQKAGANKRER